MSRERWTRFGYAKFSSIGDNVEYVDRTAKTDFFLVKYSDWGKLLGEVEVVNPKRASKVYARNWNQEWNDYTIKKLVEILEKGRKIVTDGIPLRKVGIYNQNYFGDVIEILGEIANNRIIPLLKRYLDQPKLAEHAQRVGTSLR